VHTSVAEPAIGPASPRLALIDTPVDLTHPELSAGANVTTTAPGVAPFDLHGTATASVASAPVNGVGFVGVWPGMRTLNVAMPQELRCADSARGIAGAIEIGVATINMSYGSPNLCFAEYVEIQHAVSRGVIPVAAAGNEFNEGNPLEFPASLPHVLTVAAVGPDLRPSFFSNASAAVDLSAPGSGILAAVPSAFDEDGQKDGYTFLSGTSFSAPMVAAAATWVRAARPTLESDQVAQVVRLSAQDLGAEGWDSATGFGLLSIGGALRRAPPAADPLEPNDDIVWVNGTAFGRPDPPIHRGGTSRRTIRALLDQYEDPADVYRVTLRPRSRARAEVRPSFGDADLAVFDRRATRTSSRRYLLGRSQRNGTRTDRVTLTNRGRRTRSFFVEVYINQAVRGLDAGYRLTLRRLRLR
jgi:subtilisin family serine protease